MGGSNLLSFFCLKVAQGRINGALNNKNITCEGLLVKLADHYTTQGA